MSSMKEDQASTLILGTFTRSIARVAASDRRHSHAQIPVAMSIPDLSQKVQEKIPPEEKESVNSIKLVDKTIVSTSFSSFPCQPQIREAI